MIILLVLDVFGLLALAAFIALGVEDARHHRALGAFDES